MDCYYNVKTKMRDVEMVLDDLRNQVSKSEDWVDDSIENCCQRKEIEEALSEIEDKLKRADQELTNTLNNLRR